MSFFEFPNTRSYDSDLGWLIRNTKKLIEAVDSLDIWKAQHEIEYAQLKAFCDSLASGDFTPDFEHALTVWMQENALDIVGELIKMVIFGITNDGYFVAYIPESWEEIIFNTTGYDISIAGYDFGHLTLSFDYEGV